MILPIIVTILSPRLPPFLIFFPFLSYSEPLTFPFFFFFFFENQLVKHLAFFLFLSRKKYLIRILNWFSKAFAILFYSSKKNYFLDPFFNWLDASERKEGPSPWTPTVFFPGSCLGCNVAIVCLSNLYCAGCKLLYSKVTVYLPKSFTGREIFT